MTHPEIATCAKDDSRAADERLDAAYRDVQRYLDLTARRQLQAAQRAWLAFRDADCDFWGADDSALAGTNFSMAATNRFGCLADLSNARAKELEGWPPNAPMSTVQPFGPGRR
jgi:uncharacterized protein YecT (DUF1311 family)